MINIFILFLSLLFVIYAFKLWKLLKHKSLLVIMLAGLLGIGTRSLLVMENYALIDRSKMLIYTVPIGVTYWILITSGIVLLYWEVKKLLKR